MEFILHCIKLLMILDKEGINICVKEVFYSSSPSIHSFIFSTDLVFAVLIIKESLPSLSLSLSLLPLLFVSFHFLYYFDYQ